MTLPELIAQQLCSLHLVDNGIVKMVATPGPDYVVVDISYPFRLASHMRVLLEVPEPVYFDPGGAGAPTAAAAQDQDDGTGIGARA